MGWVGRGMEIDDQALLPCPQTPRRPLEAGTHSHHRPPRNGDTHLATDKFLSFPLVSGRPGLSDEVRTPQGTTQPDEETDDDDDGGLALIRSHRDRVRGAGVEPVYQTHTLTESLSLVRPRPTPRTRPRLPVLSCKVFPY